ncbi:Protein-L-isoaspartate(D-aspartate) O-methyltransferase [Klebsormidium nitens]|uniref:protein-L-isoaspartate(D-aspartate) O-methyltransferase n=1 Tax=Klebsormidium nitens TaxID=105231 RepID=A0A1Y1IKZ1_KLENI|nr:Protein-L-isoaspartate(D-aspartate) O-methyltransferase [Klebsormidium nitens]|eukprot:GAQ88758.1 Protein-L-isoaspartate(D-aspartate) O-methyltransferase [Klebsormidium nitens]
MLDCNPTIANLSPFRTPLPAPSLKVGRRLSAQPAKYARGGPGRKPVGVNARRHGGCSTICAFEGSFAERPLAAEARRLQESDPEAKHEVQATKPIQLYGRPTEWPDYGIGPRQQKRELLERLRREGYFVSDRVEKAMHDIDRGAFMPETATIGRYSNLVVELGYNTFMHKPSYHAKVLETLEPYLQPGARVLEVGSGSGYLTACMALLVGERGKAVALDHIPELIYAMRKSVQQTPAQKLVDAGALSFVVGDGRAGAPEFAPYDVVILLEYSPRLTLPVYTQVKEDGILLTYAINPGEIEFEQKLMRRRRTGEVDEVGRVVGSGDCSFEALQVVHVNQEGYSPMLTKAAQRGAGFVYR